MVCPSNPMNKMQNVFADLHIHIGRTQTGKPVKITGSKMLTLEAILEEAATRKGIEMIGVIDCHVPEVIAELKQMIRQGQASPCSGGGIRYLNTTLILGTEMELYDENCHGPIHVLCYFPSLDEMSAFSYWMSQYQKNITLSSQRNYASARACQLKVQELSGIFIPAHIFTPFKSLYGKGVKQHLSEVFDPDLIDAVELGLSSDTSMADRLKELHSYTYLTNSDAHSTSKIAREYQQLSLKEVDYISLKKVLQEEDQHQILANYGLNPKLGKYHEEVSARIEQLAKGQDMAVERLPQSQQENVRKRPPYFHQIPLEYIPKLGPKGYEKLLSVFGSEMNVIHSATYEELSKWVQEEVAQMIVKARSGQLELQMGGKGQYGKVLKESSNKSND